MWQGMRRWSIRKQLASGTEQKTRNDRRPSVASRSRRWAEAAEAPGWAGTRWYYLGPRSPQLIRFAQLGSPRLGREPRPGSTAPGGMC